MSAYHLAALTETDAEGPRRAHQERAADFARTFTASWVEVRRGATDVTIAPEEAQLAAQIACILKCCEWKTTAQPVTLMGSPEDVTVELGSFLGTLCGCSDQEYALQAALTGGSPPPVGVLGQGGLPSVSGTESPLSGCVPGHLVEHFKTLPYRMAHVVGKPASALDFFAAVSALQAVEQCCSLSYAFDDPTTTWNAMLTWLTKVPDRFMSVVWRGDLGALVVFAQWAILVDRAEHYCWFIRGAAGRLHHHLRACLPSDDKILSLIPVDICDDGLDR
jgi:hypothetical protein